MMRTLALRTGDVTAAETYLRETLRRVQRCDWLALLVDDRVVQTYRGLL